MKRIGIESRIHGATVSNQGDFVLLATSGVSHESIELCDELNVDLRHKYASFAFFVHQTNRLCTFLHWQTGYIQFAGNGRYYTTRCVYELPLQSFLQLNSDIYGLVMALPEMKKAEEPDKSAAIDINYVPSQADTKSEESVKMLSDAILAALNSKRQVFVKLDSNEEDYSADKVRTCPKMRQLLQAVMALPPALRWCCSFLFSADGDSSEFLIKEMTVVAYHEDTIIPPSDAILLDWTGEKVKCLTDFNVVDSIVVERMKAIAPMIPTFIEENPITLKNIRYILSEAPKLIDQAINKCDNLKLLLDVYKMGEDMDSIYRYADVCCSLLQQILNGKKIDNGEAIKDYIMKKYPEEATKIQAELAEKEATPEKNPQNKENASKTAQTKKANKSRETNSKPTSNDTTVKEDSSLNKDGNGKVTEEREEKKPQALFDKLIAVPVFHKSFNLINKYRIAYHSIVFGIVGLLAGILIGVFIIKKPAPQIKTLVNNSDEPKFIANDTVTVKRTLYVYVAQADSILPNKVLGGDSIIFNKIDSLSLLLSPANVLNSVEKTDSDKSTTNQS